MGRTAYKDELDGLLALDMVDLKKMNFFWGNSTQVITWTRRPSGHKSRITLNIDLYSGLARLSYTITNQFTGEKDDVSYVVELDKTPCNLGGVRHWFICPLVKDGVPCRKRVRKLYMNSRYFGCRTCQDLTYSSQRLATNRYAAFFKPDYYGQKAEEIYEKIKVPYYNGKPTRKMRRYEQLVRRSNDSFHRMPPLEDLFGRH